MFFRYNQTDFYANPGPTGMEFKGPIWHPLRALYNLTAWSMFILVPIFYRSIFKLRKVQDLTSGTIGPCHRNIRNIKHCKRTLPRGGMHWVLHPWWNLEVGGDVQHDTFRFKALHNMFDTHFELYNVLWKKFPQISTSSVGPIRYQRDWKNEKEGKQPLDNQDQLHRMVARGFL